MNRIFSLIVLMAAVTATSCERPKRKTKETDPRGPAPFAESSFLSVTPTANGGAYAVSFRSGLWYIRGSEAIKVRFSGLSDDEIKKFPATLEIIPLSNGGAYAHSLLHRSIWYLHEDTAERVKEAAVLSHTSTLGTMDAFPLYIVERERRLRAESELEEFRNPANEQWDDYR